jgi:hypothetical protein
VPDEECRPALLLTGKVAPMKSCGRCTTTGFRLEGPQRTRPGPFRSGPGAHRGRPEASKEATAVHRGEVLAAQWRFGMPTQQLHGTHLQNRGLMMSVSQGRH